MLESRQKTTLSVNLENCESEPIHTPGSIQPHGVLLVLDPRSLRLVQWSANLPRLLGTSPATIQNGRIEELVDTAAAALIAAVARQAQAGVSTPLQLRFRSELHHPARMGVLSLHDGALLLEVELQSLEGNGKADGAVHSLEPIVPRLRLATARMQAATTMPELYHAIADEVRALCGFDRVMVYRFLADGHGAVVGESAAPQLERFLGLHYPASDIPPQARRLYRINPLRLIADIHAPPVPLEPEICPLHGRPLDLTFSAFRSVSPIHIEYLHNMGVAASMSISILRGDELWGLIACHHYTPRYLPLELRAACELLGTTAGSYLATRQIAAEVDERADRQGELGEALGLAAAGSTYREGLASAAPKLLKVIAADGAAVCIEGQITVRGLAPPLEAIEHLCGRLAEMTTEDCFDTDQISALIPEAAEYAGVASGVLMIRTGPEPRDMLLFFRQEYTREVTWAGNPQKAIESTPSGVRLSPRKSFAAWKETVRRHSRAWTEVDRKLARATHSGLVVLTARRVSELVRLNEELAKMNTDLDAFAYAASHDLKEPLRGLHQTMFFLERALGEDISDEARQRIATLRQITHRMDDLLGGLLRFSRVGRMDLRIEDAPLADIVQEAAEVVFGSRASTLVDFLVHELPIVRVDFMCVRDVFCNLFSNAIKYNVNPVKRIEVGVVDVQTLPTAPDAAQGKRAIFVRDNGIGIASEHQEAIFEIFRRLHAKDEFGGGAGAGLTIARKIVERHGGVLWVASNPGEGATFYLTLEPKHHDD